MGVARARRLDEMGRDKRGRPIRRKDALKDKMIHPGDYRSVAAATFFVCSAADTRMAAGILAIARQISTGGVCALDKAKEAPGGCVRRSANVTCSPRAAAAETRSFSPWYF